MGIDKQSSCLTCMRPDVALKEPGPGERLATHFADAGQRVCPYVHLQGAEAHILLLAVLAAERLPGLSIAVQLLVLHQSGVGGVGLGAQAALELLRVRGAQLGGAPLVLVLAPRALRAGPAL